MPAKLPPVEQCSGDPALSTFRKKLADAVGGERRDAFLKLLSPDVIAGFGGEVGRQAVAKNIDQAGDEFWLPLKPLMHLGCARSGAARVIPSLSVQMEPYDDEDLGNTLIALRGAKFRAKPNGRVLATLAWDVVLATDTGGDLWTGIQLRDGRKGWVSDDELYSRAGDRFLIEKRRGRWMITAFVAGD